MKPRICKNCGKIFYSKNAGFRYCSEECKFKYNNTLRNCDYCNKEYWEKNIKIEKLKDGTRKNLYCSRECADKGLITSVKQICENCGKEYVVFKCFENIQKYCSQECFHESQIKYDDIQCPICDKIFHPKTSDTIYCSQECSAISQQKRVNCTCDYCGKNFDRIVSEVEKNKHHYCSNVCRYLSNAWSEHDKQVLKDNYGKIKNEEIILLLEKEYTVSAIRSEAGRLGLYNENCFWTPEEEEILINGYSTIPMKQLMDLLPNRTRTSIIGKGRSNNLLSYHYINSIYSEEEDKYIIDNYTSLTFEEIGKKLNRTPNAISQRLCKLGLSKPRNYNCYKNLNQYVRRQIVPWIEKIKNECDRTCLLTGSKNNIVLHHCRGVNLLIEETIDDLGFVIKDDFNDYTQQELDEFVEYFLYLQEYYGEYCCISEKIHKLFHHFYGYGNNTMEQWNEFVDNYNNNKYKNIA